MSCGTPTCVRLNGGGEGAKIRGFPRGDSAPGMGGGGLLLRPVIGFRVGAALTEDDQVTMRTSAEQLRRGWPQQHSASSRERDLRGLIAARALDARHLTHALDASHASNRMRLASFRLMHSPRG